MTGARAIYVLAAGADHARDLAKRIDRGHMRPFASNLAELLALRDLHPVPMLGRLIPFAVYMGLANEPSKRLDSGDWATEVSRALQERTHG